MGGPGGLGGAGLGGGGTGGGGGGDGGATKVSLYAASRAVASHGPGAKPSGYAVQPGVAAVAHAWQAPFEFSLVSTNTSKPWSIANCSHWATAAAVR